MFTRFRTASAVHIFEAPLIKIPPDAPGALFLSALGGAYRNEEEHLRSRLMQLADELKNTLEPTEFQTRPGVSDFLRALTSVLAFLGSARESSVLLYSYERAPSLHDILDAFAEGGGAADWAMEEFGRKGEKGQAALLSVLNTKDDKRRVLAAVSMLLILFRNERTLAAIRRLKDTRADLGEDAAQLLAAYTST